MPRVPLVGLPADSKPIGLHRFQAVGEKYIRAVMVGAEAMPVLIPSMQPALDLRALLAELDGLLLTGAYSNIEPHHYGGGPSYEGNLHDPARDATTLSLVKLAIEMRVPVLAVCRGFQEVNVALGGTLHQAVQEQPGLADHRAPDGEPAEVQYAQAHPVQVVPGGVLERIVGLPAFEVNSVHGQGIKRLAPGLRVEARAPDGLVEAFSKPDAPGFNLCVQWHPEWKAAANPVSVKLFTAFGDAVRAYRDRARVPLPRPAAIA